MKIDDITKKEKTVNEEKAEHEASKEVFIQQTNAVLSEAAP